MKNDEFVFSGNKTKLADGPIMFPPQEMSLLNSMKAELEGERDARAGLHSFYQGQVEDIVKEKVGELQSHVSQLEEAFGAERDEAVAEIRDSVCKV